MAKPGFRCGSCGEWHDALPLDFGYDEPMYVAELDAETRERTVQSYRDFRVMTDDDGAHYFIRGVVEIPIRRSKKSFRYGVWTSLSEASYEAARTAYDDDVAAGPFFGWFSNVLPNYPSTQSLKTHVHVRPKVRAAIELERTDHPLAVEQHEGITMARAEEIITSLMHPEDTKPPAKAKAPAKAAAKAKVPAKAKAAAKAKAGAKAKPGATPRRGTAGARARARRPVR